MLATKHVFTAFRVSIKAQPQSAEPAQALCGLIADRAADRAKDEL